MAVFNAAKREIDIKIVYYGPALCGKTTNVQCVHKMLAPHQRGEMMSLATKDDRTLFFDFLPIELGDVKGFKTRFHIYTVPGQVYYSLTRRAVLTGVDGVVFVADSQADMMEENLESLQDLRDNLEYYKKDLASMPFIMQYNKRDLPNLSPVEELNGTLNTQGCPWFEASAILGTGVVETLTACCKLVLKQMDRGKEKKRRSRTPEPAVPAAVEAEPASESESTEPLIKIFSEDAVPVVDAAVGVPKGGTPDDAGIGDTAGELSLDGDVPLLDLMLDDALPAANDLPAVDAAQPLEGSSMVLSGDSDRDPFDPLAIETPANQGFALIGCDQPQVSADGTLRVPVRIRHVRSGQEGSLTITVQVDKAL